MQRHVTWPQAASAPDALAPVYINNCVILV